MTLRRVVSDKMRMKSVRDRAVILLLVLAAACSAKPQPIPLYYMAESSLRRGDLKDAVNAYKLFLNNPGPEGKPYIPRSYYMLALSYYREGRYQDALSTLDDLETAAPKSDWVQVWALRGDTNRELGKRVKAIQDWDQGWRLGTPMDRERLQRRIGDLAATMSLDELQKADALVQEPAVHDLLAERITAAGGSLIPPQPGEIPVQRAPAKKHREMAAPAATHAEKSTAELAPAPEVAPPAPAVAPSIAEVPFKDRKIACLVPLTGPDRAIGERVLTAARLAFDKDAGHVVEIDAGTSAASARTAWTTIASNPQVLGAVSWLPDEQAREVYSLATDNRIPVISLSQWSGPESAYVRPWGLSRSEEVERLVDYMVHDVHIRDFAALYPTTPGGKDYFTDFAAAVKRNAAMLVGSQSFAPGQTDWSREIAQVRNWRSRKTVGAIFVPEDAPQVDALAKAINDTFPDLILLGTAEWNGAEPAAGGAQIRAFVVDTFNSQSQDPASKGFAKRYQDATGAPPSGVVADAYEAAAALKAAIAQDKAATRADVRAGVMTAKHAVAERPTLVLRLRGGTVERVSPAK